MSEMRPPTSLLFIPQIRLYMSMDSQCNDTDWTKRKNSENTCPNVTLSTTNYRPLFREVSKLCFTHKRVQQMCNLQNNHCHSKDITLNTELCFTQVKHGRHIGAAEARNKLKYGNKFWEKVQQDKYDSHDTVEPQQGHHAVPLYRPRKETRMSGP
jgi:hypothetical protein